MGLGSIDKFPLNRARVKALALQEKVEQKINPLDEARRQRHERERRRNTRKAGVISFKQCAEAYIAAQEVFLCRCSGSTSGSKSCSGQLDPLTIVARFCPFPPGIH